MCVLSVWVPWKYLEYLDLLHVSNSADYTTFIIHTNRSVTRDATQIRIDHKMRLTVTNSLLPLYIHSVYMYIIAIYIFICLYMYIFKLNCISKGI